MFMGFPGGSVVENPPANAGNAGDMGLITGWGRSPGVGNGNLLQYSCLGKSHGQSILSTEGFGIVYPQSMGLQRVRHS